MHVDFEKNGYMVAREFFDDTTVKLMQQYWDLKWRLINISDEERRSHWHSNKRGDYLTKDDEDVGYSFNFYGDTLTEAIELQYGEKACRILQAKLSPTYTFTRIYEKGSPLIPHQDRPSCEVSATCPVIVSDGRPSTICIANYKWWEITNTWPPEKFTIDEIKTKGDYSEVNLNPGDVLFYKGCERYHWREPIESDYIIQFFMHFVEADGKFKDVVFDGRPYMGFTEKYKDHDLVNSANRFNISN